MKLVQVSRLACTSFIHDAFALGGDAPPTRSHTPLELEERLQSWDAGKRAHIWITMSTIVAKCPGVVKKDFKGYMEADPGRTPLERGFYADAGPR